MKKALVKFLMLLMCRTKDSQTSQTQTQIISPPK